MTTHPRLLRIGPRLALPISPRATVTGILTALTLAALALATLSLGRLGVAPGDLWNVLTGEAGTKATFVIERLRGPRLTVAIGAGAALAVSGALFQTGTGNPLASPDIIGITAGAGAGAVATSLWLPQFPLGIGALAGAALAAALVYLATGHGFSSPGRIILAGIGIAAMATAFIQYAVMVTVQDRSLALAGYLAGTLSARTWDQTAFIGLALLLFLPLAMALAPRLRLMELGDTLSDTLGGNARTTRTAAIAIAVALCAAAVSVTGPIAFIALTAPQITRRLTGGSAGYIPVTALTGASILVAADLAVQQIPWLSDMPVGIVTAALGGIYLGVLLVREWKKGTV